MARSLGLCGADPDMLELRVRSPVFEERGAGGHRWATRVVEIAADAVRDACPFTQIDPSAQLSNSPFFVHGSPGSSGSGATGTHRIAFQLEPPSLTRSRTVPAFRALGLGLPGRRGRTWCPRGRSVSADRSTANSSDPTYRLAGAWHRRTTDPARSRWSLRKARTACRRQAVAGGMRSRDASELTRRWNTPYSTDRSRADTRPCSLAPSCDSASLEDMPTPTSPGRSRPRIRRQACRDRPRNRALRVRSRRFPRRPSLPRCREPRPARE
jgi:hypothetical protein